VCHYDRETDSIGGHDVEVVKDDNSIRIVNATTPVGVVPESAKPFWELVEEDDGTVHEYLCTDILLWKRQEAYRKIKQDGIEAHSMEIQTNDYTLDKSTGLFVIHDFEFTAFCLLGENVEPCFESSSLEVFAHSDFKRQMEQMMADLKSTFSLKGGETLEEKLALLEEFGLSIDDLDFTIEDLSMDELREKFTAMTTTNEPEPAAEPAAVEPAAEPEAPAQENFELERQVRDSIFEALEAETVETVFGEMPRYWFVDYDPALCEVYARDEQDWKLYGFSYSMNGDNVVIDFDSKKRMKYAIVAFDEGEQDEPFGTAFAKAVEKFNESESAWNEKYSAAQSEIENLRGDLTELDTLRQFKADVESAQAEAAREEVFAQFEELNGIEEFEALRSDCAAYSIEDLTEKCYAIKGRNGVTAKFSVTPSTTKIIVPKDIPADDEPYGGFIRDYKDK